MSAAAIPLAGSFFVPTGPSSYVQLPGVILFVALAGLCCWLFIRCPSRPRWRKAAALALSLPSLYLAVDAVMMYLAFGIHR
jgi:asparagine N-glycosylation enzyme membrane subunit Stt3